MNDSEGLPSNGDGRIEELDAGGAPSGGGNRWTRAVPAAALVAATIGIVFVAGLWPGGAPEPAAQAQPTPSATVEPTPSTSPSPEDSPTPAPIPSAPPSTAPTPIQIPTPRPTPIPLVVAAGWRAQAFGVKPIGEFEDSVSAIGVMNGVPTAVTVEPGAGMVRVWQRHADGSWQLDSSFRAGGSGATELQPAAITQANGTTVMVGARYPIDFRLPEIWYRQGSHAWTKATIATECGSLVGVTRTPSGFLAFGSTCGQLPGGPPAQMEMLLFTSADGVAWTRRSIGLPDQGVPADLLWDETRLVGVGYGKTAISMISTDGGATWTTHALSGSGTYRTTEHIVRTATGYLATGLDSPTANPMQPPPIVWSSSDAISWKLVYRGDAGDQITGLAQTTTGFVMLGMHPSDTGSPDVLLWSSTDGERWNEPHVIASGGRFLPVGVFIASESVVVVTNRDIDPVVFPLNQALALTHPLPIP